MDVARECGFSVSTVSLVLNEAPLSRYVAAKTKVLVRETAERMGYRPDASARSLRSRRSETIGIMVFDISDPFCTLILKGIEETLHSTSYLPIIMDAHNEIKQFQRYLQMLLERRVEGLIVIANWLFVDIDPLADMEREHIPTVLVGQQRSFGAMSSVMVDNEAGGYLALKHLQSLGHKDIAVIRGPLHLPDSSKRWDGMVRLAEETGIKLRPQWVVDLPNASDPHSGFDGGALLMKQMLKGKKRPTAIAAFDDMTAFGAMRALRQAGLRAPEDCSVIGFDDVPLAALGSPSLTTVRQPMQEMGVIAAERILKGIQAVEDDSKLVGEHRLMLPKVIVRESTSRPR
ncbi:MAG: LacI family DNA-binding transcriptional regulator [Edaphobacter sp.]